MNQAVNTVRQRLLALQDTGYQAFQAKLMPTVDPATVIGVRMPLLRQLARELAATPDAAAFMADLPHRYYEENTLHGLLISRMNDYAAAVDALEHFLPCVDNWATCDCISPRAFARRPPQLPGQLHRWMADRRPYTVRFGIGMLVQMQEDGDLTEETRGEIDLTVAAEQNKGFFQETLDGGEGSTTDGFAGRETSSDASEDGGDGTESGGESSAADGE